MNTLPIQFPLMTLAGWVNRSHQDMIECLLEEIRVLREHVCGKRLHFADAQRRRPAIKARNISRRTLFGVGPIVTPDALVRWYRMLVAKKYDGNKARKAVRCGPGAHCLSRAARRHAQVLLSEGGVMPFEFWHRKGSAMGTRRGGLVRRSPFK